MNINDLLIMAVEQGASDLHLSAGRPQLFVLMEIFSATDNGELEDEVVRNLLHGIMDEDQKQQYEENSKLIFLTRFQISQDLELMCLIKTAVLRLSSGQFLPVYYQWIH